MNINATLIGQSVAFFIFVLFCMKFVWPPVITALRDRQKKIADGLDAANRAARDLELAHEKWPSNCAKPRPRQLKSLSRPRNAVPRSSTKLAIRPVEGERLKSQAQAEIEQELNSVKDAARPTG